MEIIFTSLTFLTLLRILNCYCYSNFNFAWIIYVALFNKKEFMPFIICNHTSTIIAWYTSWMIDPSIPFRMMRKYQWTLYQFAIGDLFLHLLPCLYVYNTLNYPIQNISRFSGLHSLIVYLLWGISLPDPFNVTDLYVPLTFWSVNMLWTISIVSHVLTMNFLHINIR